MEQILLVGTGYMGIEYAKVLNALNQKYIVIGRGEENAKKFEEVIGTKPIVGGLQKYLSENKKIPTCAIVGVSIETLAETTLQLIEAGVKKILLEKPGFGEIEEFNLIWNAAHIHQTEIFLAYNRRYYASTLKAREIIEEDGGVMSFNFEFTEWSHSIQHLPKHPTELQNWFMGNSTHVIDLAFFLGGKPLQINTFVKGKGNLSWHNKSSIFAGAGETHNGALFSYQANWQAPGRWGLEINTAKHRLIFRPLEKLQIQKIGSVAVEFVEGIDYSLDEQFKHGLYLQTKNFLENNYTDFCSLGEQKSMLNIYKQIGGY
jgi:predicted dehydrogenase